MKQFLERNRISILSFIIAIYSFPLHFNRSLPYSLDGGWMAALNLAVKNKLIFGRDFVFNYGPLGYLSTRINTYVSNLPILIADLFLFTGFYYFIYKYVLSQKGWFLLGLVTMLMFRSSVLSQSLFIIFIIYAALNLLNNFRNHFEVLYCAIAGILLFFIKINYGILTIAGLFALTVLMAITNRRMLLYFLPVSILFFLVIIFSTNIAVVEYVQYSIMLAGQYDEAGYWPTKLSNPKYISGVLLQLTIFGLSGWYLVRIWKNREISLNKIVSVGCVAVTSYVLYRNSYTRADAYHYLEYFAAMPFVMLAFIFVLGLQNSLVSKVAVVICICISGYNLLIDDYRGNAFRTGYYLSYLSPVGYFSEIMNKGTVPSEPIRLMTEEKRKQIGNKTIDIIPWEIELLQYYNMNYKPRPLPQTCGYSGFADSLNADFFYRTTRPEVVLIQNFPLDNKYATWDESISKISLHLNYHYAGFAGMNGRTELKDDIFESYLIMESNGPTKAWPQFESLGSRKAKLDDTIAIKYAPDEAIYIKVKFNYNLRGKLRRYLFQPPNMSATLFLDDGSARVFKATLPTLLQPVLINKFAASNADLKNFFTHDLKSCMNVISFVFHPTTFGFERDYEIEFLRLKNY